MAALWPQNAARLYGKALLQLLLDGLGQAASGSIPLTGSCQGLLVQLHDLTHFVVQAVVHKAPPGCEGITQHAKVRQRPLQHRGHPLQHDDDGRAHDELDMCRASVRHLWVETQQSAEAKESMTLLHIIPYMTQGCAPRPYKVPQVGSNALRADPSNSPQARQVQQQGITKALKQDRRRHNMLQRGIGPNRIVCMNANLFSTMLRGIWVMGAARMGMRRSTMGAAKGCSCSGLHCIASSPAGRHAALRRGSQQAIHEKKLHLADAVGLHVLNGQGQQLLHDWLQMGGAHAAQVSQQGKSALPHVAAVMTSEFVMIVIVTRTDSNSDDMFQLMMT
ncbi:MAG: hypothetical protein FRX49_11933 [Trebouxia sp. A1-2]|nr:MAG: hypothetical protein FRX49_11933 [Trebouxia sp. A1-2]